MKIQISSEKQRMLDILGARWSVGEAAKNGTAINLKIASLIAAGALATAIAIPSGESTTAYALDLDASAGESSPPSEIVDYDNGLLDPVTEESTGIDFDLDSEDGNEIADSIVSGVESETEEELANDYAGGADLATMQAGVPAANNVEKPRLAAPANNKSASVCKIGDVEYASLDEAINVASADQSLTTTIELLQDCVLTKIQNKNITFTGNGKISVSNYTYNEGFKNTWCFDGQDVKFEWVNGSNNWLMWNLNTGTLRVDNGAEATFRFDSNATRSNCALYVTNNSVIDVLNGSLFQILGKTETSTVGQGIQSDAANGTKINVKGGSTFLIDGTNRGYVCSPNVTVEDSTFTVQNCTSNASNGGSFTAIDSEVNFLNNSGHGLSTTDLHGQNSVFNCSGNAYYGITSSNSITFDDCFVTVNRNGWGYIGGGIRLAKANAVGIVKNGPNGSYVEISENLRNGLENYGKFVFEEGTQLAVSANYNISDNGGGIFNGASGELSLCGDAVIIENRAAQTGGGICNAGTLVIRDGVMLLNNHADLAGDDIFQRESGSITLASVDDGFTLDGKTTELADPENKKQGIQFVSDDTCMDVITGWFWDGMNPSEDIPVYRWNAHSANGDYFIYEKAPGEYAGPLALKAAHALAHVVYDFASNIADAELPDDVLILLPVDDKAYEAGDFNTPILPDEIRVKGIVDGQSGYWSFEGYDEQGLHLISDPVLNVHHGYWNFTADDPEPGPDPKPDPDPDHKPDPQPSPAPKNNDVAVIDSVLPQTDDSINMPFAAGVAAMASGALFLASRRLRGKGVPRHARF